MKHLLIFITLFTTTISYAQFTEVAKKSTAKDITINIDGVDMPAKRSSKGQLYFVRESKTTGNKYNSYQGYDAGFKHTTKNGNSKIVYTNKPKNPTDKKYWFLSYNLKTKFVKRTYLKKN